MPATKWGIFHNLRESIYTISNGEIVLYFSSELYRSKFLDEVDENRKEFLKRFNRIVVKNVYNMSTLADINLYKQIEKRGFLVELKGAKINWHELHRYALRKMTEKNTPDWSRMPSLRREM